jgi:SNF2 family DNA or RNA helicase
MSVYLHFTLLRAVIIILPLSCPTDAILSFPSFSFWQDFELHRSIQSYVRAPHPSDKEHAATKRRKDTEGTAIKISSDATGISICEFFRKSTLPNSAFLDSGKVERIHRLIREWINAGSRGLIFSQFTQVLDILEYALDILGYSYRRIDGSTPAENRQRIIDDFACHKNIPVMLLSTRAGGLGLNLVMADKVVIHDCDWNPLNDAQAEDRAYRMGQTRPVTVYRLLANHTIEVHMGDVSADKWHKASMLMSLSERRTIPEHGKTIDKALSSQKKDKNAECSLGKSKRQIEDR